MANKNAIRNNDRNGMGPLIIRGVNNKHMTNANDITTPHPNTIRIQLLARMQIMAIRVGLVFHNKDDASTFRLQPIIRQIMIPIRQRSILIIRILPRV